MKTRLEDILKNGIVSDLFKTERAIFIYEKIGEFSSAINASKPHIRSFLGYVQNLALNEAVLALSRVFDNPDKRFQNRCVLNILNLLKDENSSVPPIVETYQTILHIKKYELPDILVSDIEKGDSNSFAKHLSWHLEIEYTSPAFEQKLKELRAIRDKVLAHNETPSKVHTVNWKNVDDLITFPKKVAGIIGWAFLSIAYSNDASYFLTDDAKMLSYNLEHLLEDLNINL